MSDAEAVSCQEQPSDNVAVQEVEFHSGQTLLGTVSAAPYRFSWNTRLATQGSQAIRAVVVDTSGHRFETPPSLSWWTTT